MTIWQVWRTDGGKPTTTQIIEADTNEQAAKNFAQAIFDEDGPEEQQVKVHVVNRATGEIKAFTVTTKQLPYLGVGKRPKRNQPADQPRFL